MHRLTREVRFALLPGSSAPGTNGFAGVPALDRIAPWLTLQITLEGPLDPLSSYLRNIKDIDRVAREHAVPLLGLNLVPECAGRLCELPGQLADALLDGWPGASLHALQLNLSPFFSVGCLVPELPMTRLSQRFEFSAAHRLHNPRLDDDANRAAYGKCNNPHGHGHNYEVQVTLRGEPDSSGMILSVHELERLVHDQVIQKLDHKHLNQQVPEFADVIPTVENIARVIHGMLKPQLREKLAAVTVWETPKTWCEYSE